MAWFFVAKIQRGRYLIMENVKAIEVLKKYSENDMARLKRLAFPIIAKFGGLSQMDYDDFYSIANETLWKAARDYNEDYSENPIKFENFLYGCLIKKFRSYMTERNRQKRIPIQLITSIDATVSDDSDRTYADVIESDFEMSKYIDDLYGNHNFDEFIAGLSKKQLAIVDLIMQGYDNETIKTILNMTDKRFRTCMDGMRTFHNHVLLVACVY